jgi:hypothetical protein
VQVRAILLAVTLMLVPLGAVLAHIRERQDAYEPAWNRDRCPATRNNLRPAAPGVSLTSLTGADP